MDKTVTFDNRYKKAMEYFEMARDIYEKYYHYDALSNIYLNMGKLFYFQFHDDAAACANFTKSLEYHLKFKEDNPNTKVKLPSGFTSYENYISAIKKEAGCLKKKEENEKNLPGTE